MNSPKVFLFEFENDGFEPSKRYSLISLFFILKCLSMISVLILIEGSRGGSLNLEYRIRSSVLSVFTVSVC